MWLRHLLLLFFFSKSGCGPCAQGSTQHSRTSADHSFKCGFAEPEGGSTAPGMNSQSRGAELTNPESHSSPSPRAIELNWKVLQ